MKIHSNRTWPSSQPVNLTKDFLLLLHRSDQEKYYLFPLFRRQAPFCRRLGARIYIFFLWSMRISHAWMTSEINVNITEPAPPPMMGVTVMLDRVVMAYYIGGGGGGLKIRLIQDF